MSHDILRAAALLSAWAVLHSLLAADAVKNTAARLLGRRAELYRLLYVLLALVSFPLVMLYIPRLDRVLYAAPHWAATVLNGVRLVSAVLFFATFREFDGSEFLGLRPAWRAVTGRSGGRRIRRPLSASGLYGWCRHPMYLFALIFLAAAPVMTVGGVVFLAFALAYFLLGSVHEERRLVREYGEAYRHYRRRVNRLLPVRKFVEIIGKR